MFNGKITSFFTNENPVKEINLKFREVKFKDILQNIPTDRDFSYAFQGAYSCGAGIISFSKKDNWNGHPSNHPVKDFERFVKRFANRSVKYISVEPKKITLYFWGC